MQNVAHEKCFKFKCYTKIKPSQTSSYQRKKVTQTKTTHTYKIVSCSFLLHLAKESEGVYTDGEFHVFK
jgi:hypothetical protein